MPGWLKQGAASPPVPAAPSRSNVEAAAPTSASPGSAQTGSRLWLLSCPGMWERGGSQEERSSICGWPASLRSSECQASPGPHLPPVLITLPQLQGLRSTERWRSIRSSGRRPHPRQALPDIQPPPACCGPAVFGACLSSKVWGMNKVRVLREGAVELGLRLQLLQS